MIQILGVKKNTEIKIREKLSLSKRKQEEYSKELLKYFEEVVILSTCNRTEIYFNGSLNNEEGLKKIFEVLNWDINLREFCFTLEERDTIKHLMEVVCGFHSQILGEEQILGQIKEAYALASELEAVGNELQRLFQEAITCGKEFRTKGKFYEIPVSSASIAISEATRRNVKNIMIIGYGEIGKLVSKYAFSSNIEKIIVVSRDVKRINEIENNKISVINYEVARNIINEMDCVISCTSAPHLIIEKKDITPNGDKIVIFDLAVPRDVDDKIKEFNRVELYSIDDISSMDDRNKKLRKDRMIEFKYIVNMHIENYINWKKLKDISYIIKNMKEDSLKVTGERQLTLKNKCVNEKEIRLGELLIKSTADYYVNRAIEVLKEEKLKGQEEECIRILKKIFLQKI